MSSGVSVHVDCQSAFQKLYKGKQLLRYIIYKIDNKEIGVEKAISSDDIGHTSNDYGEDSKTAYEHFIRDLKDSTEDYTDCCYAIFNFKFIIQRPGANVSKFDKLIFIQFCPDGASIEKKMVYESSARAIKSALGTDNFIEFQASDESEILHYQMIKFLLTSDRFEDKPDKKIDYKYWGGLFTGAFLGFGSGAISFLYANNSGFFILFSLLTGISGVVAFICFNQKYSKPNILTIFGT